MPTLSADFSALLARFSSWIILSHVRPDGDAYGSALGLAHLLRAHDKEVRVYNEDGLLPSYRFLPGSSRIEKTPSIPPQETTGIIAVDTSTLERLGSTFLSWKRVPDGNIDHHISNTRFGTWNHVVPDAAATAEVLYHLAESLQWSCSPEAAACLFVGISTDTGSFCYRQTTGQTFAAATALVNAGANPSLLAQKAYQSHSPSRIYLLRESLSGLKTAGNGQIAYFHLTPDIYTRTGATSDETEGLLEQLQAVEQFEVVFLIENMKEDRYRVSLRSRGQVDVQAIAQQFGGGGHTLAAGIRSQLPLDQLEKALVEGIEAALKKSSLACQTTRNAS